MHEARSRRARLSGDVCAAAAKARGNMARANAKGSKDSRTRTRTRTQSNVGTVEMAFTTRGIVGARRSRPTNAVHKRNRKEQDAYNLDSTKPENNEPEVEVGGFEMSHVHVDALEV